MLGDAETRKHRRFNWRPVVSDELDYDVVQKEVERVLPAFMESTTEELLSVVGSLTLDADHQDDLAALGVGDLRTARVSLPGIGERFALYNEKVKGVVCRNKDEFSSLIDIRNVAAMVTLLLPVLGVAPAAAPPVAAIALAVVILRVGLNEYCRTVTDEAKPQPVG